MPPYCPGRGAGGRAVLMSIVAEKLGLHFTSGSRSPTDEPIHASLVTWVWTRDDVCPGHSHPALFTQTRSVSPLSPGAPHSPHIPVSALE